MKIYSYICLVGKQESQRNYTRSFKENFFLIFLQHLFTVSLIR